MQLLADIKTVFDASVEDKLTTEQLVKALCDLEESPWRSIRKGEPLDPRGLAVRLGRYGIGSKAQRHAENVFKGYNRAQFEDTWSRYLAIPAPPESSVTSVTPPPPDECVTDVTDSSPSAGELF